MDDRSEPGDGFTVLDGAALVIGAAVASVHVRDAAGGEPLDRMGQAVLWVTLAGVTLTAAGPFVFLARRYGRRPADYPRTGDWLWSLLGVPWLLAALLRPEALTEIVLWLGTALASLTTLVVVWITWIASSPAAPSAKPAPRRASWTDQVGGALAVAWPLQWGFVLVVIGGT